MESFASTKTKWCHLTTGSWCNNESDPRYMAIDRAAGSALHRQGKVRTGLSQRVAAHPSRQGEEREHEVQAHLLPGLHHILSLSHLAEHRDSADGLLPALSAAGLPGHEGPSVCGLHGAFPEEHASLGGARHGGLRLSAYVPGLLHRL